MKKVTSVEIPIKHHHQPHPIPHRRGCIAVAETRKLERKVTEDINESAEAFIKKFKNQLLLQRLESLEDYEKMLAGRT